MVIWCCTRKIFTTSPPLFPHQPILLSFFTTTHHTTHIFLHFMCCTKGSAVSSWQMSVATTVRKDKGIHALWRCRESGSSTAQHPTD